MLKQIYNGICCLNPLSKSVTFRYSLFVSVFQPRKYSVFKVHFWCETFKLSVYKTTAASDGHFKSGSFLRISSETTQPTSSTVITKRH